VPRFHSLPTEGLLICVRLRHGSKKDGQAQQRRWRNNETVLAGERLPEFRLSVATCPFALKCFRKRWQLRKCWQRGQGWKNAQVIIHLGFMRQTQLFNLRVSCGLLMSLRPNSLGVDCAKHSLDFSIVFVEIQRTIPDALYVIHTVISIVQFWSVVNLIFIILLSPLYPSRQYRIQRLWLYILACPYPHAQMSYTYKGHR
jgi:hypothetical protein